MELNYRQVGEIQIPDMEAPDSPKIGKYGMMRFRYLRENKRPIFTTMMIAGTLNEHLEQTDREATAMMERLTKQMAEKEGVTESLKAADQMKWVQMMNSIRSSAEEIVLNDLILN